MYIVYSYPTVVALAVLAVYKAFRTDLELLRLERKLKNE